MIDGCILTMFILNMQFKLVCNTDWRQSYYLLLLQEESSTSLSQTAKQRIESQLQRIEKKHGINSRWDLDNEQFAAVSSKVLVHQFSINN